MVAKCDTAYAKNGLPISKNRNSANGETAMVNCHEVKGHGIEKTSLTHKLLQLVIYFHARQIFATVNCYFLAIIITLQKNTNSDNTACNLI